MKKHYYCGFLMVFFMILFMSMGCYTQHKLESKSEVAVAPIEVKPIHITIDVNVRVEKALDDFFDDIDAAAEKTAAE